MIYFRDLAVDRHMVSSEVCQRVFNWLSGTDISTMGLPGSIKSLVAIRGRVELQ